MTLSGPDFTTLNVIADEEHDLERDVGILERRIAAHHE